MEWWTEADQAELDAVLWELVTGLESIDDLGQRHGAIGVALEWFYRRQLLSKADYLRRRRLVSMLDDMKLSPSETSATMSS